MLEYSVLIPLWKGECLEYLEKSILSMLTQTVLPSEIVLVIDQPIPEKMAECIETIQKKHPAIPIKYAKCFELNGKGLGAVLAYGVNACSNELIARMDTDDISKPDRCEKELKLFEKNPNLMMVGSWIDEFEVNPSKIEFVRKVPETNKNMKRFSKCRCPFNHPTVMYKKRAVIQVGNYSAWKKCEDYELWYRMLRAGYEMYNIQSSLLLYRGGQNTIQRRKNKETFLYRKKIKKQMLQDEYMSKIEYIYYVSLDWLNTYAPIWLISIINKFVLRSRKG